ncbi:hypothetical protein ScPMuIL_017540 [Solemya velum]
MDIIQTQALEATTRRCPRRCLPWNVKGMIRNNLLMALTALGITVGFSLGFGLRELDPDYDALLWTGMPGELYLRLLRMMILPLIVCSVITGSASMNPKVNGRICVIAFIYIVASTFVACLVAILLSLVMRSGDAVLQKDENITESMQTQDIFADLLRNIVPDNVVEATFKQAQTKYDRGEPRYRNQTVGNTTVNEMYYIVTKASGKTDGVNILGLLFACTLIGIATGKMADKGKAFLHFMTSATDVIMEVLRWVLWLTPIGVGSLITVSIASDADVVTVFSRLGMFVGTVTVGIIIEQIIILPAVYVFFVRKNPFSFLANITRAWLIGFAATSSAVAIPELIHALEVKNKIDRRVVRIVVPFCCTINSDGSALFITAAAVFLGRLSGHSLDGTEMCIVVILTTVMAMALPAVPSSSLVTLVMIMTSLNIPADNVGILFAVEWYLDRIRTSCNVTSHTICCAVTYQLCKASLGESSGQKDLEKGSKDFITINEKGSRNSKDSAEFV